MRKIVIAERTRPTPNGPIPCLRWLTIAAAEAIGVGADQPQALQAGVFRSPLRAGRLAAVAARPDWRVRPS